MSVISGYDKYKRYQKVSDDSYKLISHWTSSNTVHFDDGSTAEEKVEEINTSINETKNEVNTSINEVDTRITNTIDELSSNVAYIENGNEEVANIGTVLTTKSIVDNVNSSSKEMVLSAKQGKVLNERISNIIAHNNETDGNTELLDIRVDTDGTTHASAGDAIRSQVNQLSSEIEEIRAELETDVFGKTIIINYDKVEKKNGVINLNGNVVMEDSEFKHFGISAKYVKRITVHKGTNVAADSVWYAVYVGTSAQPLINENTEGASADFIIGLDGTIYFNDFGDGYAKSCTIEYYTEGEYYNYAEKTELDNLKNRVDYLSFPFNSVVVKPLEFSGKKALFVGDSITYGTTTDYAMAEKPYPQIFCESVGMTHDNLAVPGSLFSSGYNEVETIESVLLNTDLTQYDFIFIAGGVNDWQLGVPLNEFRNNLRRICQSLSSRKDANKIIFITPINVNVAWTSGNSIEDLYKYSLIISEEAMIEGINVVVGKYFNFPSGAGSLATSLFADGLHLTQKGLYLYAKSLMTVLC